MYLIDIVLKLAPYENTLPAGSQVPVVSFLRRTLTFSSPEPAEYSWLTCYMHHYPLSYGTQNLRT